jgi:hypothetical protein
MVDKRDKTVSYRRALWLNENPETINLGMCISLMAAKLTVVSDRIVRRGDQELKLVGFLAQPDKGHFLHITIETPGDSASIVPTASPTAEEVEVDTLPPPNHAEFMDGDAFVYVRGNDVCVCMTGCTDSTIRYFLAELFKKAHIRKDADQFDLVKVADLNRVSMIHSIGVKEISLKGTIYEASAHYLKRKGKPSGLLSELAKVFKADLGAANDVNADALNVAIVFTLDGRRKGVTIGEKRMKQFAEMTLKHAETDDEFIIELMDGQRITPGEIYVKTSVVIDSHGKSVLKSKAWGELRAFYTKLSDSGALEA